MSVPLFLLIGAILFPRTLRSLLTVFGYFLCVYSLFAWYFVIF